MPPVELSVLDTLLFDIEWNIRQTTRLDIDRICEKYHIRYSRALLKKYECMAVLYDRCPLISVDSRLSSLLALARTIHALCHLFVAESEHGILSSHFTLNSLMVSGCSPGHLSRKVGLPSHPDELAAVIVECCSILPKPLFESMTTSEIKQQFKLPASFIRQRYAILWDFNL